MKINQKPTPWSFCTLALLLTACSASNEFASRPPVGASDNQSQASTPANDAKSDKETTLDQSEIEAVKSPYFLVQNRNELILSLAGYSLDSQSEQILLLGATVAAGATQTSLLEPGSVAMDVNGDSIAMPTLRSQYDCPQGGTMIASLGEVQLHESSYSNVAYHEQYDFDQCRILTTGEQVLSGTIRSWDNTVSASRGSISRRATQWTGLSWLQGDTDYVEGDALIEIRNLLSEDNSEQRTVSIEHFEQRQDGSLVLGIDHGTMNYSTGTEANGLIQSFNLNGQGTVTNASEVSVRINFLQAMSASLVGSADFIHLAEPFAGMIELSTEDGSSLTMTAQPLVRTGPKLMDILYTNLDNRQTSLMGEEFFLPAIATP